MANTKQAEKRHRQNLRSRARNRSHRTRMRSAIKALRAAVAEGNLEQAQTLLPETLKVIDSTASNQVIHRNAAARHKSRLTRAVNQLAAAS